MVKIDHRPISSVIPPSWVLGSCRDTGHHLELARNHVPQPGSVTLGRRHDALRVVPDRPPTLPSMSEGSWWAGG